MVTRARAIASVTRDLVPRSYAAPRSQRTGNLLGIVTPGRSFSWPPIGQPQSLRCSFLPGAHPQRPPEGATWGDSYRCSACCAGGPARPLVCVEHYLGHRVSIPSSRLSEPVESQPRRYLSGTATPGCAVTYQSRECPPAEQVVLNLLAGAHSAARHSTALRPSRAILPPRLGVVRD